MQARYYHTLHNSLPFEGRYQPGNTVHSAPISIRVECTLLPYRAPRQPVHSGRASKAHARSGWLAPWPRVVQLIEGGGAWQ